MQAVGHAMMITPYRNNNQDECLSFDYKADGNVRLVVHGVLPSGALGVLDSFDILDGAADREQVMVNNGYSRIAFESVANSSSSITLDNITVVTSQCVFGMCYTIYHYINVGHICMCTCVCMGHHWSCMYVCVHGPSLIMYASVCMGLHWSCMYAWVIIGHACMHGSSLVMHVCVCMGHH